MKASTLIALVALFVVFLATSFVAALPPSAHGYEGKLVEDPTDLMFSPGVERLLEFRRLQAIGRLG